MSAQGGFGRFGRRCPKPKPETLSCLRLKSGVEPFGSGNKFRVAVFLGPSKVFLKRCLYKNQRLDTAPAQEQLSNIHKMDIL